MKLISAHIQNYRIHQSFRIDFEDNPTLVGGPNETGKSTLIEAIHRALFLRHNAGGSIQTGMVSTTHGGTPVVEVSFEAGGKHYRLVKGFNGPRGTVTLAPEDGKALSGDEAEEALAQLLSTGGPIGGGGAQGKLATQWAHLWIWQGKSGENPAGQVENVSNDIIQRLQESGGAVAQQSPLDTEVASRIDELYSKMNTKGGSARTGSPLDIAEKEVGKTRNAVETAQARIEASQSDADKVVSSREAIRRHENALKEIRESLKEVEERKRSLEKLEAAVEGAQRDLKIATENRESCLKIENDFTDKRNALDKLKKDVAPAAEKLENARKALDAAKEDRKKTQADLEKATDAIESARRRRDLAEAYRRQLRSKEDLADKQATLKKIEETRKSIQSTEKQLARLPEIASEDLQELRELEKQLNQARITLEAIATDVELLEGEGKLDGKSLSKGKPQSIDEPTELSMGKGVRVRISPGGGKDLEQARETLAQSQKSLKKKLQGFDLDSVTSATKALAKRDKLLADRHAAANRLDALVPETTQKAHDQLSRELDTASAKVENLIKQVSDLQAPATLGEAEELASTCEQDLASMDTDLGGKRSAAAAMTERVEGLEEDLEKAAKAHQELASGISKTEAGLKVLIEQYGNDEARADALKKADEDFQSATSKAKELGEKRDALKPDSIEADNQRLNRSSEKTADALQSSRNDLAGAEARLRSEGLEDPAELLAVAEASLRSAQEAYAREERVAGAISLLNESFKEEQRALAEQFSQPLADRINTYLQAVFGPTAKARVNFEDNQLTTIELIRDTRTGAFAFETLSGGTREQVAGAVRLAIAELLAEGFDGCLPVVFDDAFANSDPERVRELQRMLDLAVQRGLQVIILTCTPSDYATLGASIVEMG